MGDTRRYSMASISTHVLDTVSGRPARGMAVTVERLEDGAVVEHLTSTSTDDDGRVADLLGGKRTRTSVYRLSCNTAAHRTTYCPQVQIVFRLSDPEVQHRGPLLLSAYG